MSLIHNTLVVNSLRAICKCYQTRRSNSLPRPEYIGGCSVSATFEETKHFNFYILPQWIKIVELKALALMRVDIVVCVFVHMRTKVCIETIPYERRYAWC
jgi:hypothetical protein